MTVVIFIAGAIQTVLPLYAADQWPYELGLLLNRLTAPGDLIVSESGGSPNLLYFADRRGWLRSRAYDLASIAEPLQHGATYYADVFARDPSEHREFFRRMDGRFERLSAEGESWPIYRLGPRITPVRGPLQGIGGSPGLIFGGQIALVGFSVRELLRWPPAFELSYDWQCLRRPATDLRVFVHFTDATGQIAYQQDHWPSNGFSPTSEWKSGDIIRERYVAVLPLLPSTRYDIMIGWFDLASGRRLAVAGPRAPYKEDRVRVGGVTVVRAPKYGWFSVH